MANGKGAYKGADIPALDLLVRELRNIETIEKSRKDFKEVQKRRNNTAKIIENATKTRNEIIDYVKVINKKLDELRKALEQAIRGTEEEEQRKVEEEEKENERLKEEERRKREEKEEIRKKKEEEERQKREEQDRLRKEEEERQKRKELDRIRKEEEERQKREEQDRLRKEEEERRREEEERLQKEEEERKNREEEEYKRKQLEEEEIRRQKEIERKEAETRMKEQLRREEEERQKRLDPKYWSPILFYRDYDEKTDERSHHLGISCAIMAIPDSIQDGNIDCLASDDDKDILPSLAEDERLLSSVITIDSLKERLNLEAPMRAYIPHHPLQDSSDELLIKVSTDGSEWAMKKLLVPSPGKITNMNIRFVGTEVQDFETAKLVVVARQKSQSLIIDKHGTSQYSQSNKNVKLFVPNDAFQTETECKFMVKSVPENILTDVNANNDRQGSIISTGPVVNLLCQDPPSKDIEIDIQKSLDTSGNAKNFQGKNYQLYKTNKSHWQIVDSAVKRKNSSLILPAMKRSYSVLEIEVQQSTPKEEVVEMAKDLYDKMTKTVVRLVVKQKQKNQEHAIFHCVRRDIVPNRIEELTAKGYTSGPESSREFYLYDGQKLFVSLAGNIESAFGGKKQIALTFYAHMDSAQQSFMLRVIDTYKQKDMHEYAGFVHCDVLPLGVLSREATDILNNQKFDLPISLPKLEKPTLQLKPARLRFPYYLSALARFLSWKLTQIDSDGNDVHQDWFNVLCLIGGKNEMQSLRKHARHKCVSGTDQELCHIIILDWMKVTTVKDDKIGPILSALHQADKQDLKRECEIYVDYQKGTMTEEAMQYIADRVNDDPTTFGYNLGFREDVIAKCVKENEESITRQNIAILQEWRISIMAAEKGTSASEFLLSLTKQ